jgi:hypothetical protein
LATKTQSVCQSILTDQFVDLATYVTDLDDLFKLSKSFSDSAAMPSLQTAQEKLDGVMSRAAAVAAYAQFERSANAAAAKMLALGGTISVIDVPDTDFQNFITATVNTSSIANESETGAKVVSTLHAGKQLLLSAAATKGPALSHDTAKKIELVVGCLRQFSSALVQSSEIPVVKDITKCADHMDALRAVVAVNSLGPDANTRLQADATLSVATAGSSGLQKLETYRTELGGDAPGWLTAATTEAKAMLDELGDHAVRLKTAPAEVRLNALQEVSKIRPFFKDDAAHWLDESDFLATKNTEELHDFLNQTIFTVSPEKLEHALEAATTIRNDLRRVTEVFAKSTTDSETQLTDLINVARLTKAESVTLALMVENKSKPIRLKRAIKDHAEEFKDVWAHVHPIVNNVYSALCVSSAKAPKM